MPEIRINSDEKTFQIRFYESIFGENNLEGNINLTRSTDGFTDGILFEHKQNVMAYGRSKALSQALIYLTRFNADGVPVPSKIVLVSQDGQKAYIFDSNDYFDIINNIPEYASLKASAGIDGFRERRAPEEISFNISSPHGMMPILNLINNEHSFVKVDINIHNVYGWSQYYYKNAVFHGQKPEKKKFFNELRNPVATLVNCINPWTGKELDFKLIMDLLNDPMTQKKLGAFYTPQPYCELAHKLLLKAIERVPNGNDYVILDRCAGTGNLENVLSDEELSHVIINTYELKEWYVLKDRVGKRVRYIIPPIPIPHKELPDLNSEGFLSGANALSEEFVETVNNVINSTKKRDKVTIILYENPPYVETTSIEFQRRGVAESSSDWKEDYVVKKMKENISGSASNEIGNAFIWSGFNLFLKEDTDSYIVFGPIKYWKSQRLINKEFIDGYAFNRQHFHAPTPACFSCILWTNKNKNLESISLEAIDLDEKQEYLDEGKIDINRIHSMFSETYYDSRRFKDDKFDGIACDLNGLCTSKSDDRLRTPKLYNKNVVGYLVANQSGFDNARLNAIFNVSGAYGGNGFYLREDNFLEKLPIFAASRYSDHNNDWKMMSMIMKSGDKKEKYIKDLKAGKLRDFLCKCLIWSGFTHYAHIRSLKGSDGRLYLNKLCFDGKDTLASKSLKKFIDDGYVLSEEEENLFQEWKALIEKVRYKHSNGRYHYPYNEEKNEGYNPEFKYGLFQIDEEVNFTIETVGRDGKIKRIPNDGDLDNLVKSFKNKVKNYYINNLVKTLFKYEFLK